MSRTDEDIKKGLEYLSITNVAEKLERFKQGLPYMYAEEVAADAIALIQQLQADNAQLNRCIENMTDKLNAMNDEAAKLQAERDAAVRVLKDLCGCMACDHAEKDSESAPCNKCTNCNGEVVESKWQWRGIQKKEG